MRLIFPKRMSSHRLLLPNNKSKEDIMIHIGIDLHTTNMVIGAINGNGEVNQGRQVVLLPETSWSRFFASFYPAGTGRGGMHEQLVLALGLVPGSRDSAGFGAFQDGQGYQLCQG